MVGDKFIRYLSWFDLARPAEHRGHPIGTFPVRILLAAEWRHGPIRPAVHMRTVISSVHDEGVVRDAEVIQRLEHRANILVMIDHGVVIWALPSACLTETLRFGMCAKVHMGEVHPNKERLVGVLLPLDEVGSPIRDV